MYCPKCAAQNHDQTNFCRSCGTDLKSVALALNGQLVLPTEISNIEEKKIELTQQWLKLHADGVHSAVQGTLLFGASVLMGAGLAFFSNKDDWMIIWLIFCGWLAVWGAISLGTGIGDLIQSRMIRRSIDGLAAALTARAAPATVETREIPETAAIPDESTHSSVTEHTTTPLMKPHSHP
ncbi:MAG: zinc ribbon domain-containing protein [Acidobacteria bacterium]|nr:zinc ribbon domain-containing protein [Acidobacteriota bacterium]